MQAPVLKHPPKDSSLKPTDIPKEIPEHMIYHIHVGYKHLYKSILAFWGKPDFNPFMEGLFLVSTESGRTNRQCFPQVVLKELYKLSVEHDRQFPKLKKHDIWDTAYPER